MTDSNRRQHHDETLLTSEDCKLVESNATSSLTHIGCVISLHKNQSVTT